jgi:hypothetical protein
MKFISSVREDWVLERSEPTELLRNFKHLTAAVKGLPVESNEVKEFRECKCLCSSKLLAITI